MNRGEVLVGREMRCMLPQRSQLVHASRAQTPRSDAGVRTRVTTRIAPPLRRLASLGSSS
eukprot:6944922-Alexandrium_andersonii.AAC.1